MPQVLRRERLKLDIDQTFVKGATTAIDTLHGGHRVQLSPGDPGAPTINRRGDSFFYDDGTPVDKVEDLAALLDTRGQPLMVRMKGHAKPVDIHAMAVRFVEARQGGPAPKPRLDNPRHVRRGRPPKVRRVELTGAQVLGARGGSRPQRPGDPDHGDAHGADAYQPTGG